MEAARMMLLFAFVCIARSKLHCQGIGAVTSIVGSLHVFTSNSGPKAEPLVLFLPMLPSTDTRSYCAFCMGIFQSAQVVQILSI
jgi:hypothetical protein